jgi:phytoene dehydrogenase-like protein
MGRQHTSYRQLSIRSSQVADEYDVIVIGAGVGGLVCGCYLTKFGARVLVIERHLIPGGLCSFFKRKGFYFDAGAHYFGSLGDTKSFGGLLLRALDLDVEFIQLDPVDIIHYPDRTIEIPANLAAHVEMLQRDFPAESDNIAAFFRAMLRIYRHFYRGRHASEVLAGYRWSTYQDVLDRFFQDSRLKSVLSAAVGYIGVYPNRVSTIAMAAMLMSYWYDGGYLARGGSQMLPDALMRRYVASGGEILLGTAVQRIVIDEENQATSVVLPDGRHVRARAFISNADARETFFRLIESSRVDLDYLESLRCCRVSASCFIVYLGLRCDDDMIRNQRGWHWDSYETNDPGNIPLYIATPTLEDRSLCPEGHHTLTATSLYNEPPGMEIGCSDELWREYKQRCEMETMARLERIIPGISGRVVVKESATRRTIHRYTMNSSGAMYGWEASPDQFWLNRLPLKTPVSNLLLCGHWAVTGPGVISVVACGFLAARSALDVLSGQRDGAPQAVSQS